MEGVKVEKKSVTFVTLFLRGGSTLFILCLKWSNSSRNAKKNLSRGGANPLNCHTKWGGDKKKSVTNVTLFFIFYFDGFP